MRPSEDRSLEDLELHAKMAKKLGIFRKQKVNVERAKIKAGTADLVHKINDHVLDALFRDIEAA